MTGIITITVEVGDVCRLIGCWPSAEVLAADVGEKAVTVRGWKFRNAVPTRSWLAVVESARKHGIEGVTLEFLARLAGAKRSAPTVREPAFIEALCGVPRGTFAGSEAA